MPSDTTPSSSPSSPARARIAPDVLFQEVSGEAVLLNLASERYFGLDPVGSRIWQLIEQGLTIADIERQIGEEFDAPAETIASDLASLLEQLMEAGLIVVE